MFDLSLAQVSHPDRERELTADLDRRRLLKDAAASVPAQGVEPQRATRNAPARATGRITTAGR
jgi:hypothetical protein